VDPLSFDESQHRAALDHLQEYGYAILPEVLDEACLTTLRNQVDAALAAERAAPFDPGDPAILSFLGVIYYLSPETLAESARPIASGVAPGSRLVVDYMLDEASAWPEHRKMRAQLEAYVAKRGEPMKREYSLPAMSELMAEAGFRPLEAVTMMDLAERYAEELGPLPFETPGLFACGLFGK